GPGHHLGTAGGVVAREFGNPVVDVAPAAGDLARKVDGRAADLLAAAGEPEKGVLRQVLVLAGSLDPRTRRDLVPRALLGDDKRALNLRNRAALLDGGRLRRRNRAVRHQAGLRDLAHWASVSS